MQYLVFISNNIIFVADCTSRFVFIVLINYQFNEIIFKYL